MNDGKKLHLKDIITVVVPVLLILTVMPGIDRGLFYVLFALFQGALLVYRFRRKVFSEKYPKLDMLYSTIMIFDTILAVIMLLLIILLILEGFMGRTPIPPQH